LYPVFLATGVTIGHIAYLLTAQTNRALLACVPTGKLASRIMLFPLAVAHVRIRELHGHLAGCFSDRLG